jgi:hypothetical protein
MDQLTITFITATSALVSGIAGPLVSMRLAQHQAKATVLSTSRERWIEALRDAISEYVSVAAGVATLEADSGGTIGEIARVTDESRSAAARMILVRSKILLITNPDRNNHSVLHQSIEAVDRALISRQPMTLQQWQLLLEAITHAGRTLLKEEWQRFERGD